MVNSANGVSDGVGVGMGSNLTVPGDPLNNEVGLGSKSDAIDILEATP